MIAHLNFWFLDSVDFNIFSDSGDVNILGPFIEEMNQGSFAGKYSIVFILHYITESPRSRKYAIASISFGTKGLNDIVNLFKFRKFSLIEFQHFTDILNLIQYLMESWLIYKLFFHQIF